MPPCAFVGFCSSLMAKELRAPLLETMGSRALVTGARGCSCACRLVKHPADFSSRQAQGLPSTVLSIVPGSPPALPAALAGSINWLNVSKLLTITSPWVVFPVCFDTGREKEKSMSSYIGRRMMVQRQGYFAAHFLETPFKNCLVLLTGSSSIQMLFREQGYLALHMSLIFSLPVAQSRQHCLDWAILHRDDCGEAG